MTTCPNCWQPMHAHRFSAALTAVPVEVDVCSPCQLFWFDRAESPALDRHAVRELFRLIADSAREERKALRSSHACPRCGKLLAITHDLQRRTRFTYWRCAMGHGRLTGFHAFLREKNFLREPSAGELAKLREHVRQVSCSQCGAPIDLAHENACGHCRTPIALIDPDGVATTLRELDAAAPGNVPPSPGGGAEERAAMAQAMLDALTAGERERRRDGGRGIDLLAAGAAALTTLLGLWRR